MSIHLLESLLMVGTLVAAATVALLCGVGLIVWFAGGKFYSRLR